MDSSELDQRIAELAATVEAPLFGGPRRDSAFWRGVWNDIREVGQAFKTTRYPTKTEKDTAWARFQSIVADVKQQQEEHHRERKSREEQSQRVLAEILAKAQGAWPHEDGFMEFLGAITGATIIAEAIVTMMEMFAQVLTLGLLGPDQTDPRRAKLLACSEAMKQAWTRFKSGLDELLPHDKAAAYKALTGIQGELDNEWTKYKAELQEHRDERNRRFTENREAKEELIAEARGLIGNHRDPAMRRRAKELFQEWRSIKSAGRDYDDDLWQRFRGALDEFWDESKEERRRHILAEIEKVEGMIERAKANRDTNEERLENARSEDYADRVREWIEQDEANIEKFEGWLEEWQQKLNDLG